MKRHTRRLVPAFFALVLTAALLPAMSASAATPIHGRYTASFGCIGDEELGECQVEKDQNGDVVGIALGQRDVKTFTLTVTNTSDSHLARLFALDVAIPSKFKDVSVSKPTKGLTWRFHAGTVTLIWPLGLARNATSTIEVTAKTPKLSPWNTEDPYEWSTSAPQPLMTFTRSGDNPSTTVTAGPPTKLVFDHEPSDVQFDTVMAPAVKVLLKDAFGSLVKRYQGDMILSYGFETKLKPPRGDIVSVNGGKATFDALKFSTPASNLILKATTGGMQATSAEFNVWQLLKDCGDTCSSGKLDSDDGQTSAKIDAGPGTGGRLTATVGDAPHKPLSCTDPALLEAGATGVTFNITGDRKKTITFTLSKALVQTAKVPGAAHFKICYASDQPFTAVDKAGKLVELTETENVVVGSRSVPMYVGWLAECKTKKLPAENPCLASSTGSAGGGRQFMIQAPPGDPRITS